MVELSPPYDVAPGRHASVELTVADVAELRAVRLPHGIRTTTLTVCLAAADRALSLTPRPEWAALVSLAAVLADGRASTELVFAAPVPVHTVVAELGRQAVWPDRVGRRGIVLAGEELRKVRADVDPTAIEVREPDPTLALGPIDERIVNPTGRAVDAPVEAPGTDPRVIAEQAMRGVVLRAPWLNDQLARALGPAVAAAITAPLDADDPLAREEHAVVLRRAAHSTYSSHAWRRRLGELSGVRTHHQPSVSVVLATRRPEMLGHALIQVARQRGVERLELVLATHGFETHVTRDGPAMTVIQVPASRIFGDVLNNALAAASGDVVLKMDDDDWYGPDFVADLLLARAWSGAELVGVPDDWHYLEPRDQTIRLGTPVETYTGFVAGGSMLLDIGLLREVGGFRSVPRAVDAHLIGAVRAAGGAIYRTHGLGYLMRKTGAGHTWAEDLDDLTARATTTYDGFRPSRLIEL